MEAVYVSGKAVCMAEEAMSSMSSINYLIHHSVFTGSILVWSRHGT